MTAWEEAMIQRMDALWKAITNRGAETIAAHSGAVPDSEGQCLRLDYWGRKVRIGWPVLSASWEDSDKALPTNEIAMLVYYLHTADGAPPAGKWVSFRELPDGTFYHQSFQGYSGNRLAARFGETPDLFEQAAARLEGFPIEGLGTPAFRFQVLPRIELAAILWLGDEDFPARAQILFDGSACHYLTIDGCAMLGSGLVGRLIKAAG